MDAPHPRPPLPLPETQAFNPLSSNQALHNSMASFPTSGQPVIDTTLKDMLMSLQSSPMSDLSLLFHKISTDMQHIEGKVTNIESGMTECTTTVNDLIDTYEEVRDEQEWMRAKLADLEDCSRLNNIKLRGVPESVPSTDLPKYARDLIQTILLEALPRDIIIDRIHRIAKPSHLAASVPRDVLMRSTFLSYQGKNAVRSQIQATPPPSIRGNPVFSRPLKVYTAAPEKP